MQQGEEEEAFAALGRLVASEPDLGGSGLLFFFESQ